MSAESGIRNDLAGMPLKKWGWVIYRCTYADDAAWAKFRTRVEHHSRALIAQSDAPSIADSLEWTWVEDAAELDGASRAALRKRFRAWAAADQQVVIAAAAAAGAPLYGEGFDPAAVPRYNFFIQVDEGALRSVAQSDAEDRPWPREAYVNFVDANWKPLQELFPDLDESEKDESYEPIDGYREENVGWMRISPFMVNADFYDVWCGVEDIWYTFYQRSPRILDY